MSAAERGFAERLAEALQRGVPLTERPYAAIAEELDSTEDEVIEGAKALLADGVIKSIGAFVDLYRLGYLGFLIGIQVPPDRAEDVARPFNARGEVTHNYLREGKVNLWLTAIFKGQREREEFFDELLDPAKYPYIALAASKRIKLRPDFSFHDRDHAPPLEDETADAAHAAWNASISDDHIAALAAAQCDFPVAPRPFAAIAERLGADEHALIGALDKLKAQRVLRRIGAALDHRRVGYKTNALVAWFAENPEESGEGAAQYAWISHCYVRTITHSTLGRDWPYNLYTMLHARDNISFVLRLSQARKAIWPADELVMTTKAEYKKKRYQL